MKLLIDMNLSPAWVETFQHSGLQAVHWSTVGDPRATDRSIMQWARDNGYIVFTHDLDFGTLLAATEAKGPSVIQIRTQDVTPEHLQHAVIAALRQFEAMLEQGALIIIDEKKYRARILPLN